MAFYLDRQMARAVTGARPGLTLIEVMFVLLVMTSLLGMAIVSAGFHLRDGQANDEVILLHDLASSIRLIKTQDGYPIDIGARLHELGMMPSGFIHDAGQDIVNSYGGAVTLSRFGNGGFFAIEYTNVPQDMCRLLLYKVPGSPFLLAAGASESSLVFLQSMTIDQVNDICDDDYNTIVFASDTP